MSASMEVLLIILLILANGLLAMSELAVVSARQARLQQLADRGSIGARAALGLARSPSNFLSTVQVGITFVGILLGAFGGATMAQKLAASLQGNRWLAPHSEALALGVVVVAITYLSVILGELVPKRLALHRAERIAATLARPMQILSILTFPIVRLLSLSTDMVLRLFNVRSSAEPLVTEDEIRVMIRQATRAGVFEKAEQEMVERIFRIGDRRVSSLMTPRPDIVWLDIEEPSEEIRARLVANRHSRLPVCQRSLDDVLGIVRAKDLLARVLDGGPLDLRAALRRPLFVPASLPALKLLEMFKQSGMHISFVIDEHGSVDGLVTHHDVLEAVLGDIPSGVEAATPEAVQREDGSWLLDGMLSMDDLKHRLQISELPGEELGAYQTLAGFVVTMLGRIPSAGEAFEWGPFRFEVVDMDERRVDKVLVIPRRPAS